MKYNYSSFNGAYGSAKDLGEIIKGLWSDSTDEQDEAVNEGLWGWACHQYSMYSVTPYVLKDILGNIDGLKANPKEIVKFIRLCCDAGNEKLNIGLAESAKHKLAGIEIPDMRNLVIENKDALLRYIWTRHVSNEDAFSIIQRCS